MRSLYVAAAIFAAACSNSHAHPVDASIAAADAGPIDEPTVDAAPALDAPLLSMSWLGAQTPYCGTATTDQSQFYASCDSTSSPAWARGAVGCFFLYDCPQPDVCSASVLTIGCAKGSDCPPGTQCVPIVGNHAICQKTCHAAGNADCGRCDLWCSDGTCGAGGPGYPTNLPCDATHPGIDATLHGVALGTEYYNDWTFTLPGASLHTSIQYEQIVGGDVRVVFAWPAGTTAGPASSLYTGEGPGPLNYTCTGAFVADPTACVAVTLECTDSGDAGLPDAPP